MTKVLVDDKAAEQGLKENPVFVELVDQVENAGFKNVLIVYIRDDKAVEGYASLKKTEHMDDPSEFMMMAAVECCARHYASKVGRKFPPTGTEEWAKAMAKLMMMLGKRFMSNIE